MKTERINAIRNYITEHRTVRMEDLQKLYPGLSGMTLRRDLAALEAEGSITRTWGGARANLQKNYGSSEDLYENREIESTESKLLLCKKALPHIQSKHSIFLDSGTTVMTLARMLPDSNLVLFTAAPNIALDIVARTSLPQVTLLGGSLSRTKISCSGREAIDQLRGINIDIAIMCTSGYTPENGYTSGNPYESELKAAVIRKAQQVIMLLASDKVGRSMPYTFAHDEDIDILITDTL